MKKEEKKATTKEKAKVRRGNRDKAQEQNQSNSDQAISFIAQVNTKPLHSPESLHTKAIQTAAPATMPASTVPNPPAGQSDATNTADSHNNTQTTSGKCHTWPM